MDSQLTILVMPDLYAWERALLEPWLLSFVASPSQLVRVTPGDRNRFKSIRSGETCWVLSRDWRRAKRFLFGHRSPKGKLYFSVLGWKHESQPLPLLFWKRESLPENIHLITHSPLDNRFFREIEKFPENRLHHLPLGMKPFLPKKPRDSHQDIVVATLSPFLAEENLNYILNVAHYVSRRNPRVKFRLMGHGELHAHFLNSVQELDLKDRVEVVETATGELLYGADIFLYAPLQCHHFIPLYWAAQAALPVVVDAIEGLDTLVIDGRSGFSVGVNDTKPMGELVLRLAEDSALRDALAGGLRSRIATMITGEAVIDSYRKLFGSDKTLATPRVAA